MSSIAEAASAGASAAPFGQIVADASTGGVKPLSRHYSLKAGEVDPELGKKIKDIILCTELFIVYVDSDLSIQWHTTADHKEPDYCGEVLNLVATLEAQSNFIEDKSKLFDFRKRIGEGLSRCLSGYPKENAMTALKEVAAELKARNKEVSWVWYFQAAYWVTFVLAVVFWVFWLLRAPLQEQIGISAFHVVLGAICGTFGALLSATARSELLTLDANAGKKLHILEGLARVAAGFIGALLVALAIKGGIILGGTTFSGSQLAFILCFCIVAGSSERLVPSLITTVEKSTSGGVHEKRE